LPTRLRLSPVPAATGELAAKLSHTLRCTDAIMSATLDGVVTSWNASAERLYGWSADESVGRHISFVIPPDRRHELEPMLGAVRCGAPVGPVHTVRSHRNGEQLEVFVTLAPLRDSSGAVVAVAASARRVNDADCDGAAALEGPPHRVPSAERHRMVVDAIPHIVWMAGPNGFAEFLNRWGIERLGVKPEAIYGWNWLRLLHPDDVEHARSRWEAAVRGGSAYVNEHRMRHPDGSYHWYLAQAVGLRGADGAVEEWVGTWTDVDDRKQAEQGLARDARLLAHVHDSVVVTDMAGIVTYWNDGAARIFGWTADEMLGRPVLDPVPESVRLSLEDVIARVAAGGELAGELEGYRKDGSRVWIDVRVTRITDAAGNAIGVMGVSYDITARKRAEADRDRLYAQLRGHVERLPLGYLAFDADGRVVDWNSSAERIFGYSREEAIGMQPPYERLVPASGWPQGRAVIARLRAGDMTAHSINANRTKDGRTITCKWYNTPLIDGDGTFLGFVSLAQDITDRETSDAALRASEERFREIADSISEVFWLTSVDTHEIQYVSPAFETIWGRTRDQVFANPSAWIDAIHPDDRARVVEAVRHDQDSGNHDEEYRIVRPDGSVRWIRDRAFPVRDPRGQVVHVAGVAEDITARRQLEEQLRQAQKMEAIGQLAGGIAHDFNNLLTVITGNSELLLQALGEADPQREFVEEIAKAGERSASLTRQLLAFSRKQVLAPKLLDLNAVVLDTERMLRRVIGEDVTLTTRLQRPLPPIKADPGQLEQVLLNLAVNARDAMPQGGQLTIGTTADDSHVVLEVADTGIGMSEDVKRRVFEPFFTTKPAGKGTGLGLAAVHGFVAQSQGHIDVDSEPGRGTTFRIALPVADQPTETGAEAPRATDSLVKGAETILVVEDDGGVRTLTARVLRRAGYEVLAASDRSEALRLAREHHGTIHLLVTDVVMPGAGGRLVAEQLLALRPEMKVLYVSGYTDDAVVRHGVLYDRTNFLPKPFSLTVLTEKIRDVLSPRGARP
jgi:PAS domain S-box-containing protein